MKRIIAVFMLSLLIAVSLFPISASAAGELYVLNYIGNNGTIYESEYVYSGTNITVKDASDMNVRQQGYSFVEWTTNINGTGSAYSAGDTITINNHVNLYAQWQSESASSPISDNISPYTGNNNVSPQVAPVINYTYIGIFFILCVCIGMGLILRRRILRGRIIRCNSYSAQFGDRHWCSVEELAAGIAKSERYVENDIAKMIRLGYFPGARLMKELHCLILNEQGYEEYQAAKQAAAAQERERERQREADEKIARETEQEREFRLTIEKGGKYIYEISVAAETFSEQEISAKLRELEWITRRIFDHIEKHPEQISKISRLMEYYMPTIFKMIDTYKELDNKSVEGKNMASSKQEINNALDLVNTSFGKLLDGLYENISMDISTDIAVLEVLLAQEGLTKEDFK